MPHLLHWCGGLLCWGLSAAATCLDKWGISPLAISCPQLCRVLTILSSVHRCISRTVIFNAVSAQPWTPLLLQVDVEKPLGLKLKAAKGPNGGLTVEVSTQMSSLLPAFGAPNPCNGLVSCRAPLSMLLWQGQVSEAHSKGAAQCRCSPSEPAPSAERLWQRCQGGDQEW